MCSEYNLDISSILGTGKEGRVLKEDVIAYLESSAQVKKTLPPTPVAKTQPQPVQTSKPQVTKMEHKPVFAVGQDRTEPIKGIMKAMTKAM